MTRKFSIVVAAVITVVLQLMYFMNKQNDFSGFENRELQLFPSLNITALIDGSFQSSLESALKDQIFGRNSIMGASNTIKGFSRKYYNIADNFLKSITETSDASVSANINNTKPYITPPSPAAIVSNTPGLDNELSQETPPIRATPETSATPSQEGSPSDEPAVPVTPTPSSTNTSTESPSVTIAPTGTPAPTTSTTSATSASPTPNGPAAPEPTKKPDDEPTEFWLEPAGALYCINDTDYMSYYPFLENSQIKKNFSIKAKQMNMLANRHPDVKVYAYYVTKSDDLNWFNKKEGIAAFNYGQFLFNNLSDKVTHKKLAIPNFAQYKEWFFKTDHHWNHKGAYQGYTDIYSMLKNDFDLSEIKKPTKEEDFGGVIKWYGSKAKSAGVRLTPDDFIIYEYDLGKFDSYFGDQKRDIGLYNEFKKGNISTDPEFDYYINFYGYESNIIRHEFPGNKYNLLIIGDSNNRPIRKPLASHFKTTYFIDYRLLKNYSIDNMIEQKGIDAVLFIGEHVFWNGYFIPDYPQ